MSNSTAENENDEYHSDIDTTCYNNPAQLIQGFYVIGSYPVELDKKVEKYHWRQKTQELMKKTDNFITEYQEEQQQQPPLYMQNTSNRNPPNYFASHKVMTQSHYNSVFYPGAKRSKLSRLNSTRLTPPALKHNYTLSELTAVKESDLEDTSANTPASSPVNKKNDKPGPEYLTEECEIIELAESGAWIMVMEMIDNVHETLVNSFPENKDRALIHIAIHQENVKITEDLLNRGANPTVKTRKGLSCIDLIGKGTSVTSEALKTLVEKHTSSYTDNDSDEVKDNINSRDKYLKELDEFMLEMKFYMSENNLEDDEFMKNLCDDIYV